MKYNILFSDESVYNLWYEKSKKQFDEINHDVNLDIVAQSLLKINKEFPVQYILYPCENFASTKLRCEVFEELKQEKNENLRIELKEYTHLLSQLQKYKNNEFNSKHTNQKQYYLLDTVSLYIDCIKKMFVFTNNLKSIAFVNLHNKLDGLINSLEFQSMKVETANLKSAFKKLLDFTITINYESSSIGIGDQVDDGIYKTLSELSERILGTQLNPVFSIVNSNPISSLEEDLIKVMKLRSPQAFVKLSAFFDTYSSINFFDIINLKNQLIFYLDYIEFVKKMELKGFKFTLPVFTDNSFCSKNIYDIGLAIKLQDSKKVVTNDISLSNGDIFVLSGPNQGGKTTFIRGLAQSIVLAQNGCFVPGEYYETPYYDKLLTHFNHVETLGHGRLQEEIKRIQMILPQLTKNSFVLFNECFVSTRRVDAVELALNLLNKINEIGCCCGFVTHYYEISEQNDRLISLVAGVESNGEKDDVRTYKILKHQPNGTAYAHSIALNCGVTFEQLKEVIDSNEKN